MSPVISNKMHQHRRRKKRPSYGVRTVEIVRGKNGFGFTISGQAPCILSCIVSNSPAEKAGLRPGDFLIAVNGQNVSKVPHDDVVRLIGSSTGLLKLQIAENYYSDSSEEEFVTVARSRPKYPHRMRNRQQLNVCRAEKVVHDLQTGALFVDHIQGSKVEAEMHKRSQDQKCPSAETLLPLTGRSNKALLDLILQQRLQETNNRVTSAKPSNRENAHILKQKQQVNIVKKKEQKQHKNRNHSVHINSPCSTNEVFNSIFTEQDLNDILYPSNFFRQVQNEENEEPNDSVILKAVVGYLGTIEMPKEPQLPSSRLQTIRSCIRRLRIEKKVHTLVLLCVYPESVVLTNPHGLTLAEFPAEKITFSGVYADDKKFFGLVTSHGTSSDEMSEGSHEGPVSVSSSCHVFMVDTKLLLHHQHIKRAKAFRISCTPDPVTNKCREFPESADSILQAIVSLYRNRLAISVDAASGMVDFHLHMSPQPSNTSSNSSNSDSGIGFRDEGNHSDRVFVVDMDHSHPYSMNSLDRQVLSLPNYDCSLRMFALSHDTNVATSSNAADDGKLDRLTVRAMPDPVGLHRANNSYNTERLDAQCNASKLRQTAQKFLQLATDRPPSNRQSVTSDVLKYKLSPKVYGLAAPTGCRRENMTELVKNFSNKDEDGGSQDVHPPIQDDDSESDAGYKVERGLETAKKWARTSSLRRHLGRKRSLHQSPHEAGTVSDGELANGKLSTSSSMLGLDRASDTASIRRSSCNNERPVDVGRVGSWAAGFDKLLEDPIGLYTFTEFLKLEFSQENIMFWMSCEQYNQLTDQNEMKQMANEIFKNHLCIGASEPVNVDSHARQVAQEGLENPTRDLFIPAQTQIFNLMKFDCYQRFLKSQMFKDCMMKEMQGQPLPYQPDEGPEEDTKDKVRVKQKGKEKKEEGEDKKRKSLIPWHRLSKTKTADVKIVTAKFGDRNSDLRKSSKKKKKDLIKNEDASSTRSDMTDSHSSLTGSELGLISKHIPSRESLNSAELALFPGQGGKDGYFLCRVILSDSSTAVVKTQTGETIGEMLQRILERRGLAYTALEAYIVGSEQLLDQTADVSTLGCKEVKVEQVILFCLELPNKKTIGVRAKPDKLCSEVIKPILQKHGYKIDQVVMHIASTQKQLPFSVPITVLDSERVILQTKEDFAEWGLAGQDKVRTNAILSRNSQLSSDLEEITNQIFEAVMKGKSQIHFDELGTVDLDCHKTKRVQQTDDKTEMKTSTSSNSFMGLVRRNSVHVDSDSLNRNKTKLPFANRASVHESMGLRTQLPNPDKFLFTQTEESSDKGDLKDNSDDLLEVWNRAQRSRLDDQRGTEINFELPEFLKNKSDHPNGKENCLNMGNRLSVDARIGETVNNSKIVSKEKNISQLPFSSIQKELGISSSMHCLDHGFSQDTIFPTHQQAEKYFSSTFDYHPCFGFGDIKSSEKYLLNLGISQSSKSEMKNRPVPPPPGHKFHSRPTSHSLPCLPPHICPTTRSLSLHSQDLAASRASPARSLDDPILDGIEDLDIDLDVTLKAQSSDCNDTLTPSKIPMPPDSNTSLHVEEANFTPPSPLNVSGNDIIHKNEIFLPPQPPLRKLLCEPPPIPPKAQSRGPPPRPPSRQLININPSYTQTSDEDHIEEDRTVTERIAKSEGIQQKRSSKCSYVDRGGPNNFNISFV
ncbi:regulator of G-protein signaling loco-like isoform X2 [Centruroides vittatus]|uniref:regulator of G-protein signaling loco-like isoform X2 n=1 Tax=Centruroides vittatus TaxID=120091 RepID=UPI00350F1687